MIRLRPERKLEERSNPITPSGYAALKAKFVALYEVERPKIVEIVSWAASNGDRSENGDYQYGKKRLREIDRESRHLSKRLKAAHIIDPAEQPDKSRVYFGATVILADDDDARRTVTLLGEDETDVANHCIGWNSPLARALKGGSVGDLRIVQLPSGPKEWEIMEISYPGGL
jgi:transcription elongation factor GreB